MGSASVLNAVFVESPCAIPWDAMRGNDRSRFFSHCRQNVFNLSAMTRMEAEDLIRSKNEALCVRYFRRSDGTIATKECAGRWRRKLALAMGLPLTAVVAMFGWLIWKSTNEDRYHNVLRSTEPFATMLEWIDPAPPTPCVMGGCPTPPRTRTAVWLWP